MVEEEESKGLGFCPDLQPDLCVGTAGERLLVGSQDAAHHLVTLRQLGVTHILNVAWGVPNAFPNVSRYEHVSTLGTAAGSISDLHKVAKDFINRCTFVRSAFLDVRCIATYTCFSPSASDSCLLSTVYTWKCLR